MAGISREKQKLGYKTALFMMMNTARVKEK